METRSTNESEAASLRPIKIDCGFLERRPDSVIYASGMTRVLVVASVDDSVPSFLEGRGSGWATAEYDLLPGSTMPRRGRERSGRLSGRTQEIQRLIGRTMRGALDLALLPERTLKLDCDVIEADGGTRTAAINGAWLAMALAIAGELEAGRIERSPLIHQVSAVSVGIVDGQYVLDLAQVEDSRAEVDLNVAMTDSGAFLEIQGTAEGKPYTEEDLAKLMELAKRGIEEIRGAQLEALKDRGISRQTLLP